MSKFKPFFSKVVSKLGIGKEGRTKLLILLPPVVVIFAVDFWTKLWAVSELPGRPRELFGGLLPLTLAYNKGAAFGINVGSDSRWLFVPITIVAVIVLLGLVRSTQPSDRLKLWALSFVLAGAIGNLYDRVRWDRGVVDMLGPIDLGFWLFPIFNVADMSITCGAVALGISFWRDDAAARAMLAAEEEQAAEEKGSESKNYPNEDEEDKSEEEREIRRAEGAVRMEEGETEAEEEATSPPTPGPQPE